jgi:hypothetical protein
MPLPFAMNAMLPTNWISRICSLPTIDVSTSKPDWHRNRALVVSLYNYFESTSNYIDGPGNTIGKLLSQDDERPSVLSIP